MKVLVLGANGMAGHTISLYFKEKGHETHGLSIVPIDYLDTNYVLDVMDKKKFISVLRQGVYDCIINCIGILNKAADDNKALSIYLNSYLPHFIVDTLKDKKTKLIHMSTDCVFSGEKGSYKETDFQDGKTYYDRTKALGEVIDDKNLTFRNSIIGPDINKNGVGLFNWFMNQQNDLEGYVKAIWTGVTTLTLAKAMEQAIIDNLTGIYNLVNDKKTNKYELLCLFNKHFKNSKLRISPANKAAADKSLVNTRRDFSFEVPSYEDMVVDMKRWIYSHKELYPHYFWRGNEQIEVNDNCRYKAGNNQIV